MSCIMTCCVEWDVKPYTLATSQLILYFIVSGLNVEWLSTNDSGVRHGKSVFFCPILLMSDGLRKRQCALLLM